MSEATKVQALSLAIQYGKDSEVDILDLAKSFDAFITGEVKPKTAGTTPATKARVVDVDPAAAKAALAKKAAAAKAAKAAAEAAAEDEPMDDDAEVEDEEPEAEGVSKDDVKAALQEMIDAGLTDEVTALLKKFKAVSLSKLDEKYYDKVLAAANAAVAAA